MLEYVAQVLAALQKGYYPLYPFELDPTFRRWPSFFADWMSASIRSKLEGERRIPGD